MRRWSVFLAIGKEGGDANGLPEPMAPATAGPLLPDIGMWAAGTPTVLGIPAGRNPGGRGFVPDEGLVGLFVRPGPGSLADGDLRGPGRDPDPPGEPAAASVVAGMCDPIPSVPPALSLGESAEGEPAVVWEKPDHLVSAVNHFPGPVQDPVPMDPGNEEHMHRFHLPTISDRWPGSLAIYRN